MTFSTLDELLGFLRCQAEDPQVLGQPAGEEVLAQAQDLQPQVILIGLEMPGLTGLETISRLRNILPGVGIIALTLLEGNVYRQAALAAGADDVVRKADRITDLLPIIQRVTQGNRSR